MKSTKKADGLAYIAVLLIFFGMGADVLWVTVLGIGVAVAALLWGLELLSEEGGE
jgi:hypothetical protein